MSRISYIDKACQSCRSSKRRCLREKADERCKRCIRLGFECVLDAKEDRRKGRNKQNPNLISTPYNFLLVEAGGLPLSEERIEAIHDGTINGSLPSIKQIDWLIDDELRKTISEWCDVELGCLFPQLPNVDLLRSQRRQKKNIVEPAELILEFAQYLCASRHLYLSNLPCSSTSSPKRFPGSEIEAMVRPLLQHSLSLIILQKSITPALCLAFQLLCIARIDRGEEKQEAPYILLSSSIRSVQIARAGSNSCQRDRLLLKLLWCTAFTFEISNMLGTKEGQMTFDPNNYAGLSPNGKDVEEIIDCLDSITEAGYVGLERQICLPERRIDAIKAALNRTTSTIVFCKAWQDIWQSTKALRQQDKSTYIISDEDQLICLAKTGQAMSYWDEMGRRLSRGREKVQGKLSKTLNEFLEVEWQFANSLLLGHCLRTLIESEIDVDVLEEFNGIGQETALLTYVRLMVSENVQAAKEAFGIDRTRLDAAKQVLLEQVGKLSLPKENRIRDNGKDNVDIQYPALISLGHFFEASKEVLQAHAPHLEISRSNLALHDSWAILAWAVKGLVNSLLISDLDLTDTTSPSSVSIEANRLENATQILERHCQHVEARMILDLPFPLPSTVANIEQNSPIAIA